MDYDVIPKLKPWVTTFSGAIPLNYKHGDTLCVGGKITHIFNLVDVTQDKEEDVVYLGVDDAVGEMNLMVPYHIYKQLDEKFSFREGMLVLANGRVLDPDSQDASKKKLRKPKPSDIVHTTLLCWNIEPLSDSCTESSGVCK